MCKSKSGLSMNRAWAIPRHLLGEVRNAECGVRNFPLAICHWLLAIASGRFMVPMHAQKRKGAFHEPRARSGKDAFHRVGDFF